MITYITIPPTPTQIFLYSFQILPFFIYLNPQFSVLMTVVIGRRDGEVTFNDRASM